MGQIGDGGLVGRARDLHTLQKLAGDLAHGHGGAIAISGPRGIGKSALLRQAVIDARRRLAADQDASIAWVTAAETERGWRYSGLHLVVSAVVGSYPPGPRAAIEPVVQEFLGTLEESADPYDVAVRLQALDPPETPLTMAFVDDAHLLDDGSQAVLGFVARRLRATPAVLVLAADESEHASVVDGLATIRLAELAEDEAIELVTSAYDDVVGPVAHDIVAAIGGNPGALREVTGQVPASQRRGYAALDQPLPSSPELRTIVSPDLDLLDDPHRHALLTASISEDGLLGPVMSALQDEGPEVVRWLTRTQLEVTGDAFRLSQPAVASAVWWASGVAERAAAHAAMAAGYADHGSEQAL